MPVTLDSLQNGIPHPFAIEVSPVAKPEGQFGWATRKSGKLLERSDRSYVSEEKAYEAALKAAKPSAF